MFVWAGWFGGVLPAHAADDPAFAPERRPDLQVQVDGVLDEALWQNTDPLTRWYQQQPNEGAPPSQSTQMWIVYDETALYVAARLDERAPDAITARTLERDSYDLEAADQDAVALILDTFDDDRSAVGFIVTPAGVRTDIEIAEDGDRQNANWNAFWSAATQRNATGWSVEMRIPFSSLRFSTDADDTAEMGLILWRHLARNAEYDVYPAIPNNWSGSAYKPSQAAPVRFRGIRPSNPFYVKPYALSGIERQEALNGTATAYTADRTWRRDVGLDVKHNVTSDLILDLTLNTDFAQVEADDERINLSRFSLFFPEKRDFFQERANLFTYRLPGGPERLFQSRRIGIVQGQPTPILGGARLTGRLGGWEVGLIEMQTARATIDTVGGPSENFGVLRLKRPVLDRGSYVGGMVTSRTDFDGRHNLVAAADADLRLWADYFAGLQLAQSTEPGADAARSLLGAVVVQRRLRRGWSFGSSFRHTGSDFRPGVGFLRRAGINRWGHRTQYTWFPATSHPVQNHSLAHRFQFIWNSTFDRLETSTTSLSWDFLFRSSAVAEVEAEFFYEQLDAGFLLGNGAVAVAPGTYRFVNGEATYTTRSGTPLQLEAEARGGGYFGGAQWGTTLAPSWTPSPHLSLQLDYVYNRIDLPQGDFDGHIARFRVRTALNRTLSASAFVQYNSSEQLLTPNVRLRYNPREGSDLYVVFNEGRRTDLAAFDGRPHPLRVPQRTLLVKYTYTFVL